MTDTRSATTRFTEATRNAIVQASVELVLERKGDAFSVQDVAERAGLAHRTVYRHFPTRMQLLGATASQLLPRFVTERFEDVSNVNAWIEAVASHFSEAEAQLEVVRSVLAALLAAGEPREEGGQVDERDAHRSGMFRREFPHISAADARSTYTTLRHLLSSTSYVLYRIRFGLSAPQATDAIQSAARLIAGQARVRDRAAARSTKRR